MAEVKRASSGRSLVRALRPHQWAKNALVFAPITLSQQLGDPARLANVALGFAAFCAVASAGYLVNDWVDVDADRAHPDKSKRPFAAGTLSPTVGFAAAAVLLAFGFIAAGAISPGFASMMGVYLAVTLSYSFFLKERLFLDVLVLAGLYTHRVLAGGVAGEIMVSAWLLAFSVFFFLSLALVKRYVELLQESDLGRDDSEQPSRRAYQLGDATLVGTMGITSGYLSVLVLGLYVSRDDVTSLYATPGLLWLVTPLMLYWISRLWLLAHRGELTADPVLFAATDRTSYGIVLCIACAGLLAAFWGR